MDKSKHRLYCDMGGVNPLCDDCTHRLDDLHEYPKCKAFPNNIPKKILIGDVDHRKPYEGDNGIQFEPKEETE